jgi:hypothetical protein
MTEMEPRAEEPLEGEQPRVPITFWIMIVLVVLYLGWRLVQGIVWVVQRLAG